MTTVHALYKQLGKLIDAGHGRKPVVINKRTFTHPLEDDGVALLDVESVTGPQWINMSDDDGGTKINRDGSESGKRVVVLCGASPEEPKNG